MTLSRIWNPWAREADDPDSSLLADARRGRQSAFDALRRRYEKPLMGFIANRVGHDAAEDLSQEVWLACWTNLSQYTGRSRFKAWLYGVAAHKCADHFRLRASDTRREEAAIELAVERPDEYEAVAVRQAVRDALDHLPDAQRQVLELYYYARLTLAEIAEALGRNLNTVKYQFYRGHDQVARELKSEPRARQ